MAVQFPLFVYEPGDPTSLYVVQSLDAAERGEIEQLDVEHENFVFWDATGVRVRAAVRRAGDHWLELTATGPEDMPGLRRAIVDYALSVGVPPEDVLALAPSDAVNKLEEAAARRGGPRRWYQFWR